MKVLTIYDKKSAKVLAQKSEDVPLTKDGLKETKAIVDYLFKTIEFLQPAAGLAAPQIGISKRVFVYSWNRGNNMEVVVNPKILHHSDKLNTSWEACFSAIQENGTSKAALVSRSDSIIVSYYDLEGNLIKKQLTGFAAKVFQHEYDHLEGIENVRKEGARVETFKNYDDLVEFVRNMRATDSTTYKEPVDVS